MTNKKNDEGRKAATKGNGEAREEREHLECGSLLPLCKASDEISAKNAKDEIWRQNPNTQKMSAT